MLKWTLSEWKNINRECASLFITHTLTHWGAWVRHEKLSQVWEREQAVEIIFYVFGFYCYHWCSFYLWGSCRVFVLYGFPEENSLCLLSLVFIAVHVILSDKILRSYCLNDKNLTSMNTLSLGLPYSLRTLRFDPPIPLWSDIYWASWIHWRRKNWIVRKL